MKHNDMISRLERRLRMIHKDAIICREEKFWLKDGRAGETDLYLVDIPKDYSYVFEVKTWDYPEGRVKAYNQCNKDAQNIYEKYGVKRVIKFYVHSKDKYYYNIERILNNNKM